MSFTSEQLQVRTSERTVRTSTYTKTIINFKMHFFHCFFSSLYFISIIQLTSSAFFSIKFIHSFDSFDLELSPPIFRTHNSRILNILFHSVGRVCMSVCGIFFCHSVGCRVSSLFGRSFGFFFDEFIKYENEYERMNESVPSASARHF